MNAVELLDELRQRDAHLTAQDGRLSLDAPVGAITDDLLIALREQKSTLLQVVWRAAAMRTQVRPKRAIPVLVARDTTTRVGHCISCGDPIPPDNPGRCGLCVTAAVWVLREQLGWETGANEER